MRLNTKQKQLFDVCFVRTSVLVFGEAAHVIIVSVLNACFVVARMAQGPQPSRDKDKKDVPTNTLDAQEKSADDGKRLDLQSPCVGPLPFFALLFCACKLNDY